MSCEGVDYSDAMRGIQVDSILQFDPSPMRCIGGIRFAVQAAGRTVLHFLFARLLLLARFSVGYLFISHGCIS